MSGRRPCEPRTSGVPRVTPAYHRSGLEAGRSRGTKKPPRPAGRGGLDGQAWRVRTRSARPTGSPTGPPTGPLTGSRPARSPPESSRQGCSRSACSTPASCSRGGSSSRPACCRQRRRRRGWRPMSGQAEFASSQGNLRFRGWGLVRSLAAPGRATRSDDRCLGATIGATDPATRLQPSRSGAALGSRSAAPRFTVQRA